MNDTLDLDALTPAIKTVKVNGKLYDVLPLKLKDFLNLQDILKKAKGKTDEEMLEVMTDIFKSIKPIVPQIDEMNLTIPQTMALIGFIYKTEQAEQGTDEKKGGLSPLPSPNSPDTTQPIK